MGSETHKFFIIPLLFIVDSIYSDFMIKEKQFFMHTLYIYIFLPHE